MPDPALLDTPWLRSLLLVLGAGVAAVAAHRLLIWALGASLFRGDSRLREALVEHSRRPARLLLVLLALRVVAPFLALSPGWMDAVARALTVGVIVSGAWLVIGLTEVAEVAIEARFPADVPDNLRARRVRTKVKLLKRIAAVVTSVIALALILVTFPQVRRLGLSLFASAGVAGLVVGIAAQPTLSNLVAGLQVALTEPIRIDDVVIVEGEWGWIEEIGMTYVVVRIWDLRRLVVPLRHFIEHPFENWTRTTAEILGTVVLHVDYRTPMDPLREELHRILQGAEQWDGEVWNLQVVDVSERTVKVRALMSAASSGAAWELRCLVREKLIDYLRREHPDCLPRVRGEMEAPLGHASPDATGSDLSSPVGSTGSADRG